MSILPASFNTRRSPDCSVRDVSKLNGTELQLTPLHVNLIKLTSAGRCYISAEDVSAPRSKYPNIGKLYAKIEKSIRNFGRRIIGAKSSSHAPATAPKAAPDTKEVGKSPRDNVLEKLDIFRAELDQKSNSYAKFKEKQLAAHSSMQTLTASLEKFLRMSDDHKHARQGARPTEAETPANNTRQGLPPEQTTILQQLATTLSHWATPAAHQNQVYTFVPREFREQMEGLKSDLAKAASIIRGTYERDFGVSTPAVQAEGRVLPEAPAISNEQEPDAGHEISAGNSRAPSAEPSSAAAKAPPQEQAYAAKRTVKWDETPSITIPDRELRGQWKSTKTDFYSILKTPTTSSEAGLDKQEAVDQGLAEAYEKATKLAKRVEDDSVSLFSEVDEDDNESLLSDLDEDDNAGIQPDRVVDEDSGSIYDSDSPETEVDLSKYGVES